MKKLPVLILYYNGAVGYNNGVFLLNDICEKHYSNKELGVKARSINLEDIESHFTSEGIAKRDAWEYGGMKYGDTRTLTDTRCTYTPDIYNYVSKDTTGESVNYYPQATTETYRQESSLQVKNTYFDMGVQENYINNNMFYILIFGSETADPYWIATRSAKIEQSGGYVEFGIRYCEANNILTRSPLLVSK